jgi:hypothetical protein
VDPQVLAERLKETAEAMGVEVRTCPAETEGGPVLLRGRRAVFVPEGAPPEKATALLAEALAPLDLEGIYLLPAVREAIEARRKRP